MYCLVAIGNFDSPLLSLSLLSHHLVVLATNVITGKKKKERLP
jgi:hypothetical protein